MNYLKELHLFFSRHELDELSASAILLWHTLIFINNKKGWAPTFTIPLTVLQSKSGLKKRTVINARAELQEKGYLHFQSRSGRQSAVYEMKSLAEYDPTEEPSRLSDAPHDATIHEKEAIMTHNHAPNDAHKQTPTTEQPQRSDEKERNDAHNSNHNASLCTKQERKQKPLDVPTMELYTAFHHHLNQIPTPNQLQTLKSFQQSGMEQKLILYALQMCGERGKPYSYAKGILTNWKKHEIQTYEDAVSQQKRYFQQHTNVRREADGFRGKGNEEANGATTHIKLYR